MYIGLIHERSVEEEDGWEGRPLVKPEAPPVSTRPRYESVMLPNLLAYITEKEKNRARGFQQEYEVSSKCLFNDVQYIKIYDFYNII